MRYSGNEAVQIFKRRSLKPTVFFIQILWDAVFFYLERVFLV